MDIDGDDLEGNMVEIREFVDDNGAEVSSEVVTLSDEAKSMNKGDMGQLDHIMEKLQENLKMGAGKGVEVDEHAHFIREIALMSSLSAVGRSVSDGDDLDFLDEWEQKEAAAAADDEKHVFGSSSSGWKKGFLGGSGSKPKKEAGTGRDATHAIQINKSSPLPKKEVSFTADTLNQGDVTSEDYIPAAKPVSQFRQSIQNNSRNSTDIAESTADSAQKRQPVAFNGVIKER